MNLSTIILSVLAGVAGLALGHYVRMNRYLQKKLSDSLEEIHRLEHRVEDVKEFARMVDKVKHPLYTLTEHDIQKCSPTKHYKEQMMRAMMKMQTGGMPLGECLLNFSDEKKENKLDKVLEIMEREEEDDA